MTEWPGGKAMFVDELLAKARERLVTITDDALLMRPQDYCRRRPSW